MSDNPVNKTTEPAPRLLLLKAAVEKKAATYPSASIEARLCWQIVGKIEALIIMGRCNDIPTTPTGPLEAATSGK